MSTGSHLVTLRMEPRVEDGNTEIQKEAGFLIILGGAGTHTWTGPTCLVGYIHMADMARSHVHVNSLSKLQ